MAMAYMTNVLAAMSCIGWTVPVLESNLVEITVLKGERFVMGDGNRTTDVLPRLLMALASVWCLSCLRGDASKDVRRGRG